MAETFQTYRPNQSFNLSDDISLFDTNPNCFTYTYKTEISGEPELQIALVDAVALTDNSIIIGGNERTGINAQTGVLVRLQADGTIIRKSKFAIGTRSLKIEAIQIRNQNLVLIAGTFLDNKNQFFVATLNTEHQVQKCVVVNVPAAITGLQMDAMHRNGIYIALDGTMQQYVYNLSEKLERKWSVTLGKFEDEICKGIFVNSLNELFIGRQTENNINPLGHLLRLNASTGAIIQAFSLPSNLGTESMKRFSGFSHKIGWVSIANDNNNFKRITLKESNVANNAGTARIYQFPQNLDTTATVLFSRAFDGLAMADPTKGVLYFFQRDPDGYDFLINPTQIDIPLGFTLKSFLRTTDAGFVMGLENKEQSKWLFIKTDSSGKMGTCPTIVATIDLELKAASLPTPRNIEFSSGNMQINITASDLTSLQIKQIFECKDNICQTPPQTDTCNPGYVKLMRSSFLFGGVYSGFLMNDKIYTYGLRRDNYSSNEIIYSGTLERYDLNGIFEKGVHPFINGLTSYPEIWKAGNDSIIMHSQFIRNDTLHYLFTCMDKDFNVYWNSVVKTQYRPNNFTLAPVIYEVIHDDVGNFYCIFSESNLGAPNIVGAFKLSRAGKLQWSAYYSIGLRASGTTRATVTPKGLVLLSQSPLRGAVSMLLNMETGALEKSFSIPENFSNSVSAEPNFVFSYQNGFIFYVGYYASTGRDRLMVTKLDDEGKPIIMKAFNNISSRIEAGIASGFIDAVYAIYDPVLQKYKEAKIRLSENLEVLHSGTRINDIYFSPRALMPDGKTGSTFALGFWYFEDSEGNYLSKFDPSGHNGICVYDDFPIAGEEIPLTPIPFTISKTDLNFQEAAPPLVEIIPQHFGLQVAVELCKSTEPCNSLSLEGPSTLCKSDNYTVIEAKRNPGCALPVTWFFDTSAINVHKKQNDTLQFTFKKSGIHTIVARLFTGCTVLEDSLTIQVSPAANAINLGSDTTLCPGDSILLDAGSGFPAYKWNTGATDSAIWVSKAGKYFVTVDNTCGEPLSDTIEIFMSTVPPLSTGPDSSVCTGSTFERLASDGFASYQWKNVATQSIVSNSRLLEQALTTTSTFALTAANADGCIRFDTLSMQVISARPFSLGPNQNLCAGDTTTFAAPEGYASYVWNTGATTRSINAWQQGQYILAVTDTNGCHATDTVLIVAVFALPLPALGTDQRICAGSSVLLNPGNFARYQWQDGSTQNTFNAAANGTYFVQVWDANNCTASDTMQILEQLPNPAGFLAETDSLCQYEKLILQPNAAFKTYLWSTGSTQPNIQVDKAGLYALRVTDNNNCMGTDTIQIIQKSCMEGIYIPNAFTPNSDAVNDVFRPLVFGVVIKYEFSVYNRFGERIFVTNETGKGWDGTWKGKAMPANTYAWMCAYHLQGGEAKVERGMVTLIR